MDSQRECFLFPLYLSSISLSLSLCLFFGLSCSLWYSPCVCVSSLPLSSAHRITVFGGCKCCCTCLWTASCWWGFLPDAGCLPLVVGPLREKPFLLFFLGRSHFSCFSLPFPSLSFLSSLLSSPSPLCLPLRRCFSRLRSRWLTVTGVSLVCAVTQRSKRRETNQPTTLHLSLLHHWSCSSPSDRVCLCRLSRSHSVDLAPEKSVAIRPLSPYTNTQERERDRE